MNRSVVWLVVVLLGCGSSGASPDGDGGHGGSQACSSPSHVYACPYVECRCPDDPAPEIYPCLVEDCTPSRAQSRCASNGCDLLRVRDVDQNGNFLSGSGGSGGHAKPPPNGSTGSGGAGPHGAGGSGVGGSTGASGGDEPGCVAWQSWICENCNDDCNRNSDAAKEALQLCDETWDHGGREYYECQMHASSCAAASNCN